MFHMKKIQKMRQRTERVGSLSEGAVAKRLREHLEPAANWGTPPLIPPQGGGRGSQRIRAS